MSKEEKRSLGDRMKKNYENRNQYSIPRRTYTIIRLDGKAFHSFTKHIKAVKPFDHNLMTRMDLTAKFLCYNIQGCQLAYIQSDEISLLLTDFSSIDTHAWYDGNIQKMASVSSSLATGFFNSIPSGHFGDKVYSHIDKFKGHDVNDWVLEADRELAYFDSRAFCIPDKIEVYNYLVWRIKDWETNSLSMVARKFYTQGQLEGKDKSELFSMIKSQGEDWTELPSYYRKGRFCSKAMGGMWNIHDVPEISDPEEKRKFIDMIPSIGY